MKIVYRLILLISFLTLPVWGATLSDLDDITNSTTPICIDHKVICTFKVVQSDIPLAYTQFNNITLSSKTVSMLSKEELRSVVFHEVAHAVLRHSTVGQQYILSIYNKGRQPTQDELKAYRHKAETDADSYSALLLFQYGYPNKLPEALVKLSNKKYSEETLTHPSDRDRINNIRNLQRILK